MALADLDYAKVIGRFGLTIPDSADVGNEPDITYCDSGTVTFTPINTYVKVAGASPVPTTLGNAVITATIDANGYLTYNGQPFVMLVDLGSSKVNPSTPRDEGAYTVTFNNVKAGSTSVAFPSFAFNPAAGVDNDLTTLAPVPVGTGVAIIPAPPTDADLAAIIGTETLTELGTTFAAKPDNGARAIGKGELIFNVRDFGATGNGSTDDKAAILATMNAATAAGAGREVFLPPGVYRINGTLSLAGQTCQLRGAGSTYTGALGAGVGSGTVLRATAQTGPVLDFRGYTWPTDHRGRLSFGNFTIEGDGASNPSKVNTGITLGSLSAGDSPGGARFHDITIAKTGGPGMMLTRVYLCDFDRITVVTPVGAKANNVPYVHGKNVNATQFSRLGLRSISASADVGANGAVVLEDDGTWPSYGTRFLGCWTEYLHPPTGSCIFKIKANYCTFDDVSFSDDFPDTGASNTAYFRLEPSAVDDLGGNRILGMIPGGVIGDTVNYMTYGVVVSQKRNAIVGVKGFRGSNVRLLPGSNTTYVHLGGSVADATDPGVINDSAIYDHTLIDEHLGIVRHGPYALNQKAVAGNNGAELVDPDAPTSGSLWLGNAGVRIQAIAGSIYATGAQLFLRNTSLTNNFVKLFFGGSTDPSVQAGTGSPEGVMPANVGSLYLRSDGGAGTCIYVKESGTGNTGWRKFTTTAP